MGSISTPGAAFPPMAFQKAMVFVDGTNLFYRLKSEKLKVEQLRPLLEDYVSPRQLARAYLYTVQQHRDEAKQRHGDAFFNGIRVVLGDGIPLENGNIKEKGVDALLVADMVYHAASRNCEYAVVVTTDTDFVHVLKRVEDFGCRTAVLSFCCKAPPRLAEACDDYRHFSVDVLLQKKIVSKTSE